MKSQGVSGADSRAGGISKGSELGTSANRHAELFTVVWNGAHHGVNRDLLCVTGIADTQTVIAVRPVVIESWADTLVTRKGNRQRVTVEQDRWVILQALGSGRVVLLATLRRETGIDTHRYLHQALKWLRERGWVRKVAYARLQITAKGQRVLTARATQTSEAA